MGEEQNGVTKGSSPAEMSPQEDGTKVPLTSESPGAGAEVKFTSNSSPANGDAKIDVGDAPTFSGLTKEELMKFSNDPFWIRIRWFLFLFFWFAWLAMLVAAIVIIVLAPGCVPPPQLVWVQESAMLDSSSANTNEEFMDLLKEFDMKSAYISKVISDKDFDQFSDSIGRMQDLIAELETTDDLKVVTDFIPDKVPSSNAWHSESNYTDFFINGNMLNYNNTELIQVLKSLLSSWVDKGVSGFIMDSAEEKNKLTARDKLDKYLYDEKYGAVVSGIVNMDADLPNFAQPDVFAEFIQNHVAEPVKWKYFKYNPHNFVGQNSFSDNHVPLITMGLFTIPGTPIYSYKPISSMEATFKDLMKELSTLRTERAIQFGNTTFALNLENDIAKLDFTSLDNVPEKGKLKIDFLNGKAVVGTDDEEMLNNVELQPYEGKIIQYVPKF